MRKLTAEDISGWGRDLFDVLVKDPDDEDAEIRREFEVLETAFVPAVAQTMDIARRALLLDPTGSRGLYEDALFVKKLVENARDIVAELATLRWYGLRTLVEAEKAGQLIYQKV